MFPEGNREVLRCSPNSKVNVVRPCTSLGKKIVAAIVSVLPLVHRSSEEFALLTCVKCLSLTALTGVFKYRAAYF